MTAVTNPYSGAAASLRAGRSSTGGRITGISRTSLWAAWKEIRKTLHKVSVRDSIDFFDYDLDPEVWIRRLLREIAAGTYEPKPPIRFTLAKGNGFSRRMVMPSIPDLVLYRAIVDRLYRKVKRRELRHVYFERALLNKAANGAEGEARSLMTSLAAVEESGGRPTTRRRYLAWLHYAQYRRHLLFQRVYPWIVTTDITNFFDSVLYDRVQESLFGSTGEARLVGLLFYLLERLAPRESFAASSRIGLPVDEFDCSRKLAHVLLFPHDRAMADHLGEDAYVRWMDDQNFGTQTRGGALRAVALASRSLSGLHLTCNAAKTRILRVSEARRHFHLDTNDRLDRLQQVEPKRQADRSRLRREGLIVWREARAHEGDGEWSKVLKRFYLIFGRARARTLRRRALQDIIQYPNLVDRIVDYMRATGSTAEFLAFHRRVADCDELPYPDVLREANEALLRLHVPSKRARAAILSVARDLLSQAIDNNAGSPSASVAPLLILKYGDGRSLASLRAVLRDTSRVGRYVVRGAALVLASAGASGWSEVQRAAARFRDGELEAVVRLVDHVVGIENVPERFKSRAGGVFDPMTGETYVDVRRALCIRLLRLNRHRRVQDWLRAQRRASAKALKGQERSLVYRLWRS